MRQHQPLVSIVILHYQDRDAFERTLASVCRQSYADREIIVVANGRHDDIRGVLEREAPEAQLVQLEANLGACGGRNAGILAARGDIIITLDNDIAFEGNCELGRIVEAFNRYPDIHVLAFKVCDGATGKLLIRGWCHPRDWKEFSDIEFETNYINEGACAIRREVYERAGLYYEPLFFGTEGWDLALRIMDRGFRMLYVPGVKVRHLTDDKTRPGERQHYSYTRNYIWTAAKDYPIGAGVAFLAVKLSMMLYLSIRTGHARAFARGFRDGIIGMPAVLRDRAPVSASTLKYVRKLEQTRPSLWLRLGRHRKAVQL
ncbi:MAG: glycosyltransferase family 2 protein [Candidatus Binataceae bacterium]